MDNSPLSSSLKADKKKKISIDTAATQRVESDDEVTSSYSGSRFTGSMARGRTPEDRSRLLSNSISQKAWSQKSSNQGSPNLSKDRAAFASKYKFDNYSASIQEEEYQNYSKDQLLETVSRQKEEIDYQHAQIAHLEEYVDKVSCFLIIIYDFFLK